LTIRAEKGVGVSVLEDLRGIEERVVARLRELRPLVDEYAELEQVAARFGFQVPTSTTASRAGGARGRRKAVKSAPRRRSTSSSTADGRRRPGGTQATGEERRARVLALIEQKPGITVREISSDIGVDPPPIYRVVRKLQADGLIKKEGTALTLA
jgi:Winged helix-turn-helix DNA-binding